MYRKNDERIFITFSILANILAFASFLLILVYHFYEGRVLYRDLAIIGLCLSAFSKFQIMLLKVFILECRVSNLMEAGRRPGKIAIGMGNVAILIYSIMFWMAVLGCSLAFLPADWQPKI